MRININVGDLTPAQFDWLMRNTVEDSVWHCLETAVCVVFEAPEPHSLVEQVHRELPVRTFIGIVEHLKTITHTAEALLTPDALPGGDS